MERSVFQFQPHVSSGWLAQRHRILSAKGGLLGVKAQSLLLGAYFFVSAPKKAMRVALLCTRLCFRLEFPILLVTTAKPEEAWLPMAKLRIYGSPSEDGNRNASAAQLKTKERRAIRYVGRLPR